MGEPVVIEGKLQGVRLVDAMGGLGFPVRTWELTVALAGTLDGKAPAIALGRKLKLVFEDEVAQPAAQTGDKHA